MDVVTSLAREWFLRHLIEEAPPRGLLPGQPGELPG